MIREARHLLREDRMIQSYRDKIDRSADARALQIVLEEMEVELNQLNDSPYADEESYRRQIHDLELLLRYGEDRLGRMLS